MRTSHLLRLLVAALLAAALATGLVACRQVGPNPEEAGGGPFVAKTKTTAGAASHDRDGRATRGEKTAAKSGPKTVCFVGYSSSNPFWLTLKNGAEAAAKERGVKFVDLTSVQPKMEKQQEAIRSAIAQKVDGLVVGAVDSRGLGDTFKLAHDAGIPIVTVDTRVDDPQVKCHIATDNPKAAALAGAYIVKRTGGKGKVLLLGGTPGSQTAEDRRKGVEGACQKAGMQVIYRPANWDGAKANEITSNELAANPDLKAIFAACDPMIVTAKEAVKQAGKQGKLVLVGFDAIEACLKAIQAGEIDATVRQDPYRMGHDGMIQMVDCLEGKQIPRDIPIQAVLVEKSNVGQYLNNRP